MAWSAVALLVLGLVLLGFLRARAGHGTKASSPAPPSERPSARIPAGASAHATQEAGPPVRSCPVCLGEYPPTNRFCVRDGAPLHEGSASGPFLQGMICPTCRRGYTADASFCPEDSDELVPYGLFGAASATRPQIGLHTHKICPECGVRHAPAHLFCGHDGAELVVVN